MPSMTEPFEYVCPATAERIVIRPNAAATHVDECPKGSVVIVEVEVNDA